MWLRRRVRRGVRYGRCAARYRRCRLQTRESGTRCIVSPSGLLVVGRFRPVQASEIIHDGFDRLASLSGCCYRSIAREDMVVVKLQGLLSRGAAHVVACPTIAPPQLCSHVASKWKCGVERQRSWFPQRSTCWWSTRRLDLRVITCYVA